MNGNLWHLEIAIHKIPISDGPRRLLLAMNSAVAVQREVPKAWYFLALFLAIAIVGGLGFAAGLQRLYRRKEGLVGENRGLVITVPRIGIRRWFSLPAIYRSMHLGLCVRGELVPVLLYWSRGRRLVDCFDDVC